MKILSLELYNVGSYKGVVSFDLDKTGIILLRGKQGTGKTTILNALSFGLFNDIKKSDKTIKIEDIQNWYVKKNEGFYVKVVFKTEGEDSIYRTINARNHPNWGSAFRLQVMNKHNRFEDISDKTTETEPLVKKLIGCDYSTFTNSVYIRQKSVSSLMGRPAQRLEIFLRLIGLEEKFKTLDAELKTDCETAHNELVKKNTRLEELSNNQIIDLDIILERKNILSIHLIQLFERSRRIYKDIKIFKRSRTQVRDWADSYEKIGDHISHILKMIESCNREIAGSKRNIGIIEESKGRELNSIDDIILERNTLEEDRATASDEMESLRQSREDLMKAQIKLDSYKTKTAVTKDQTNRLKKELSLSKKNKIEENCYACNKPLDADSVQKMKEEKDDKEDNILQEIKDKGKDLEDFRNGVILYTDTVEDLSEKENRFIVVQSKLKGIIKRLNKISGTTIEGITEKYDSRVKEEYRRIASQEKKIKEYQYKINESEAKAEEYEEKLMEYGGLDSVFDEDPFEEDINTQTKILSKIERKITTLHNELDIMEVKLVEHYDAMEKLKIYKADSRKAQKDFSVAEQLRKLFKKYRLYVVNRYLESVNSYMNKYLRTFGFPYSVSQFEMRKKDLFWTFYNGIEWKDVRNLSGGEEQSLLLSGIFSFFKVLSSNNVSNAILCDEPLAGLDTEHQETFFQFLEDFRAKDMLVIISSHSIVILDEYFDEVWHIKKSDKISTIEISGG